MSSKTVTETALLKRINRSLYMRVDESDRARGWPGERVRKTRDRRNAVNDLGRHHLVDVAQNTVIATHVDLDCLARELGVMSEAETLAP